ncbi:MAG TPA: hypothetical protein VK812_14960, partial [Candidatus Binatus sp.]|nr:hypothetical protein [Candidatus Binatus sp.]
MMNRLMMKIEMASIVVLVLSAAMVYGQDAGSANKPGAGSDVKKAAKTTAQDTKTAAKTTGHATKSAAKETGKDTKA